MKKSLFTLAVLFTSALSAFAQPASVPGIKEGATDVYQLYVNGGQNGFNFDPWGGATLSEETIDGKKVEKETNFAYSGSNFTDYDAYEKEYFHLDVYPMQDMTLGVVLINKKSTGGNEAEKGYQINDLKANEWNSIDIPVKYYVDKGASMERVFQVKLIGKVTKDATDLDASDEFQNADGTQSFYIGNYYFYGKRDTSSETGNEFGSFSIDLPIVGAKGTTTITADPRRVNGRTFSGDVTYSIDGDGATLTQNGNELTIVTTKAGTYTITAKSGEQTATATLTAIEPTAAPTDDAQDVLAYYSDTYNAAPNQDGISQQAWNWGFVSAKEINLSDNDKAYSVAHAGSFGFSLGAKDITSYTKLHADIYASKAASGHVHWEGGTGINEKTATFNLNEGWNSLNIDISGNTGTAATWLQFYVGDGSDASKIDFVIDNVYAVQGEVPFAVAVANGVAKVSGPVTAADAEQINNADAMAIDLTGVKSIDDGVTISPKHPNALIFVSGTHPDNVGVADAKYAAIAGTNNLVVKDNWIFPVAQLQFIDKAGEPQWFGENATSNDIRFISAGNTGVKVTTTIPAKKYITLYPTAVISDIPAGVNVWHAAGYNEGAINFTKVDQLAAFEPYVLYNTNDEDATISFVHTGDFSLVQWSTNSVDEKPVGTSDAKVQGNFLNAMATDGNQWILKNNDDGTASFVKANGPKISAFRAYFTGLGATTAAAKAVFDGGTTGINSIQVNDNNSETSGYTYNVAGQRVGKDYKGLVIKNGKKYINK